MRDQRFEINSIAWSRAEEWDQYLERAFFVPNGRNQEVYNSAITGDHLPLFLRMLQLGHPPNWTATDFGPRITKFLTYKPSRDYENIYYHIINLINQSDPDFLQRLIKDEENTSEEESSNDLDDEFVIINPNIKTDNVEILARGNHFGASYYNSQQRRSMSFPEAHQNNIYSLGTQDVATTQNCSVPQADKLVKNYFTQLKAKDDKQERNQDNKIIYRKIDETKASFESLYFHFIQVYVNSYGNLFNKGGARRNFDAPTDKNTLLSVTPDFTVACRYGSGERINHSQRFFSKLRRSTGEFKYRGLGYIEIYFIDPAYMQQSSSNIGGLINERKIGVNHNYTFNEEIVIESSIPKEYIFGFQRFSLPKMRGPWNQKIKEVYGLNEKKYNEYKNFLKSNCTDEAIEMKIKKLIEDVTEFQANRLKGAVELALKNQQENNQVMNNLTTHMGNVRL